MNTDFLKEWSVKLNVDEKTLADNYEQAIKEMKGYFPNQPDDIIAEKAKLRLKADYKKKFLSNATPFIGIVFGATEPVDNLEKMRNDQLNVYFKAKEEADKAGDLSIVKKAFDCGAVRLDDEKSEIVALWPKFKKDGTENKLAGQDMPTPEESQAQLVIGVCMKEGSEDIKPFKLTIRGKKCNPDFKIGEITSFRALDKTSDKDAEYILQTNGTDFIYAENEKLQAGIDKVGITGIIETFFKDYIASWEEIGSWIAAKKENPESYPIPAKFSGYDSIMIVSGLCVFQNFTPDKNGRIKMSMCSTDQNDLDDASVNCLMEKAMDSKIKFAANSKIIAIGKPWLPKPDETGNTRFMLMTSSIYSYPDWTIPRIENAKELDKSSVNEKPEDKW